MGFVGLDTQPGLTALENFVRDKSYIQGYSPSQADIAVLKAIKTSPDPAKFPHTSRWYRHISSYEDEFSHLPGDPTKPYTAYGPEAAIAIAAADEDEDIDLFGSDDEEDDAEAVRIREERLAEYNKKKAGKSKPAAKSIVTLDVKPWDDETDMKKLEASVRSIEKEGLVWGGSKLVPVGFGIKKLQITLVVEDDKVSLEELQQEIEEFDEYCQSTDIAAMQKL